MVLTSNQSFSAWCEVFGDRVIATAILDRLLHHAVTLNIRGNSYRLKEKLKAGLIRSTDDNSQPVGKFEMPGGGGSIGMSPDTAPNPKVAIVQQITSWHAVATGVLGPTHRAPAGTFSQRSRKINTDAQSKEKNIGAHIDKEMPLRSARLSPPPVIPGK